MIRQPIVAGQFYPDSPELLRRYLEEYVKKAASKEKVLGAICPHAGYIFSGSVAGAVYGTIEVPDTVIILGPNHTGIGLPFAVMSEGLWLTPLGEIPVNSQLAQLILDQTQLFEVDARAHQYEHSIEVQLPFLQYVKGEFDFVPIVLSHTWYSNCEILGKALANAIGQFGKPVLIIASSDMTHYEPDKQARAKDKLAIEQILKMDPRGLYEVVNQYNITMCGIIPATVMMVATKELGASQSKLVAYATSGDISGDYGSVVGYAGIIVK